MFHCAALGNFLFVFICVVVCVCVRVCVCALLFFVDLCCSVSFVEFPLLPVLFCFLSQPNSRHLKFELSAQNSCESHTPHVPHLFTLGRNSYT